MPEQASDTKNSAVPWIKRKLPVFTHINPTPRILLFFIAILINLIASALSGIGFVLNNPVLLILGTIVWLVWFAILFLVAVPAADRFLQSHMRWLKPTAITIFIALFLIGLVELVTVSAIGFDSLNIDRLGEEIAQVLTSLDDTFAYTDATALCHQATENFLDSDNPYAQANIVSAMTRFNIPIDKLTPLRQGSFAEVFPYPDTEQIEWLQQEVAQNPEQIPPELESKLGYPAGCFLLPAPFVLLGMSDLRLVYLLTLLPALAYVIWRAPPNLRLLLVAALVISLELWNSLSAGETGFLLFPFLLLAWILPKRNLWMSALFMGLAVTIKQVAWFFIPFYLILIFRTEGLKRMFHSLAIITCVFFATNIPFMISDIELWSTSILSPMSGNMFPLGVGIVTIVSGGLLEIQSPLMFSILEFFFLGLAIIWYFRYCPRYPHTGPILAILPLFFAWRSLWPYFFYVDIIVLAAVIINEYGARAPEQLS
jgi:hypothetical protein